jgi:hypothetical protein
MKKIFLILFVGVAGMLFSGCMSTMVYLQQTPSELVLANVKSENREVSCTFRSNIPNDFDLGGYNNYCNMNAAYRSNLLAYMNTKFSLVDQGDVVVDVVLLSCNISDADVTALGKSLMQTFSFSNSTDRLMTTKMVIHVAIRSGQQVIAEKTITTSDQMSYESGSNSVDPDAAKVSYNRVIDKNILMLDKYLSTFTWSQNPQAQPIPQQIPQAPQHPVQQAPQPQPAPAQQPGNSGSF